MSTTPRDLPHVETVISDSTSSSERRTIHCRSEPADGHTWQSLEEEVSKTPQTGRIGTSPSYWMSLMLALKRMYTCEEAVLIMME